MSFFEHIPLAPTDPILGLTAAFHKDPRREKVNLGVGLYKEETLLTPVLDSVKIAENALLDTERSKEYLPIEGDSPFLQLMGALIFGEALWEKDKKRIAAVQTVGGTGALHVGGTFLKKETEGSVHIPHPSWPNHRGVFTDCGFTVLDYPYYDAETHALDFEKMCAHFEGLEKGSIVVLHACCHNPTGIDPTPAQWDILGKLFKRKQLLPFFDSAYQGFGDGLGTDAYPIRHFTELGLEMLVAISCAKNFSLYAERVGCLFLVNATAATLQPVLSRLRQVVRTDYSNPPSHGAKIVSYILGHLPLRKSWEEELKTMRERIDKERALLCEKLETLSGTPRFNHMKRSKGMFGLTGLSENQVERIIEDFGIYMTKDGRINFCGLNAHNIDYVAKSLIDVL